MSYEDDFLRCAVGFCRKLQQTRYATLFPVRIHLYHYMLVSRTTVLELQDTLCNIHSIFFLYPTISFFCDLLWLPTLSIV